MSVSSPAVRPHWMDMAAGLVLRSPIYTPFFPDGWGNEALLDDLGRRFGELSLHADSLDLTWEPWRHMGPFALRNAHFMSPVEELPDHTRQGHLQVVAPSDGSDDVVILLAATNDHGYQTRYRLALPLARSGITVVMLENPFYGERWLRDRHPTPTVADAMLMGYATVQEARSLATTLQPDHQRITVGGFSMGGSIATMVSARLPFPIGTASLAPGYSPGPGFTAGTIATAVNWEALGGAGARERLAEVLGWASTLRFPPPPHDHLAIFAIGKADAYIPDFAFQKLAEHWPQAEVRVLPGGHVSTLYQHRDRAIKAVRDVVDRVAAHVAVPGTPAH